MVRQRTRDGLYIKIGLTQEERLAKQIKESLPCPIVGYGNFGTWMTQKGFEDACKGHQKRDKLWPKGKPQDFIDCQGCSVGRRIMKGRKFKPPKGIKLVKLESLRWSSNTARLKYEDEQEQGKFPG